MAKNHLKRLAAPATWPTSRKSNMFIARPNPGAHRMMFGVSLATVMTDMIKCANTKKEVKSIIQSKNVLVDGRKRRDDKFMVGIMDTLSIKETGEHYRMVIDSKGKMGIIKIDEEESLLKPCKITGKSMLKKGLVQLNLIDGRNITVKKDTYSVGDTIMISLPGQAVKDHFKLEQGMTAYLIGGKQIGDIGTIEAVEGRNIRIKSANGLYETAKEYAFVVGKDKPAVKLAENKKHAK